MVILLHSRQGKEHEKTGEILVVVSLLRESVIKKALHPQKVVKKESLHKTTTSKGFKIFFNLLPNYIVFLKSIGTNMY